MHEGGNEIRAGFFRGGLRWRAQAAPALFFCGLDISVLSLGGFNSKKGDKNSAFFPMLM